MKLFDKISKVIFPDSQAITEEIIRHYGDNPDELELIIDREYFHAVYLGIVFIIGFSITVLSRVLQFFYGDVLGDFVNTVILDVGSELGIAIFGGAVVAYLIEFLNKKQFQQNVKFRRDIIAILEERKTNK